MRVFGRTVDHMLGDQTSGTHTPHAPDFSLKAPQGELQGSFPVASWNRRISLRGNVGIGLGHMSVMVGKCMIGLEHWREGTLEMDEF